jgi:hypothetical protein
MRNQILFAGNLSGTKDTVLETPTPSLWFSACEQAVEGYLTGFWWSSLWRVKILG